MKKLQLISLFVFIFNFSGFSQEITNANKTKKLERHELKLNSLYMILGAFEGTYEYSLNDESGVGISLFLPIEKDNNHDINYYFSPYYRLYFGKKYAAGFFIEGFGLLSNSKIYGLEYYDSFGNFLKKDVNNETNFALGFGMGAKWFTKRGLIGEVNFGLGRNLFKPGDFSDEFIGKISITVGYRF